MGYDVYGIGNALVDMEFEVTDQFLKNMNLEKGLMTLVDQKRQSELLEKAGGIQHKRTCGGSAANSVIGLAQLGGKAYYSCKVSNDDAGSFYMQSLLENGVRTNLENTQRPEGVTGKCMVFVTPEGERTMETYLGITETFSESELNEDELAKSKYLYVEGYLVTSTTGRPAALKAMSMARTHGVKVAMTFSDPAMPKYFKDGLQEMVGKGVDLLFCNEEEAITYTGRPTVEEAMLELKKIAKSFVITQGSRGALIYDGQKEIDIMTSPVTAVDTNGAGDLFAGAFLYGMCHNLSHAQSGRLACALAGQLVTQFGARLRNEQTVEIKKKILGE